MIANVKLEGTVNRIVTINGERFEAFDGSFVYGDGPNCDKYVADYDPNLAEQLDRLCELVDVTDEQYASYDVNLVDDSISNLKIELADLY